MSIFSTNYDWDRKDDDPLSNLTNDNFLSNKNQPLNDRSDSSSAFTNRETRKSSTFLDNFMNEDLPITGNTVESRKSVKFDESTIQTPSTARRSTNLSWLGLNDNDETSANPLRTSTANSNTDEDDWLTSGLNKRQQRRTAQTGKSEELTDNQTKSEKQSNSLDKTNEDTEKDIVESSLKRSLKDEFDSDFTVLRTKVSILEIEKQHLTESIDKLNVDHENEVKLLKQLHEQQLGLTKSMLSEQESLIKDERDRRIQDLQNQLNTMERYLEENRIKKNEKIDELEKEWVNEVQRLKNIHELTVNRLIEQHEQDLERLKKIKEREIETLQNFQTKLGSLDVLLVKWQENSEKMENLHLKISNEKDKLLDQRQNDIDLNDKWSKLADNLQSERESSVELKELFVRTVDEQKRFIDKEKEQLREDRNEFEKERKKFLDERRSMEMEMEKSRELMNQNLIDQRKADEHLKAKQAELNQQQIDQIRKENEWRVNYERENDKLINQSKQLESDKQKLRNDQVELSKAQETLTSDRKLFEQKKDLFDKEKIKLENLAYTIVKRSEELEELSETVNLDRKENEKLFYESEKLKKEFDEKLKILEASLIDLKRRELHLEKQSEILHQDWRDLQNEKLTIRCTLCEGSLNQDKQHRERIEEFLTNVRSSDLYLNNINEDDRSLIIWQITGQEDAALLEEEREFLRSLKK